jgi:hypothetical protein
MEENFVSQVFPSQEQWEKAKAQMQNGSGEQSGCCDNNLAGTATGGLGQAWGGTYPPLQPQHVCPACGYCPCCGRGRYVPNYPPPYWPLYVPYVGDYPNWPTTTVIY